MKRRLPATFEVEIAHLGERGVGLGTAPDGRPVRVAGVPPGARALVAPMGHRKGTWDARRLALVRPPPDFAVPPCAVFATCGGCAFQEHAPHAQRIATADMAWTAIAAARGEPGLGARVRVHPPVAASPPYGYRNRVELSFAPRRWLPEARRGEPIDGRWLGFHAPGRFDRVVDAQRCELAGEGTNRVIASVRGVALSDDAPPPWDARAHDGFWRHLLVRETAHDLFVGIYTASGPEVWPARVADAVLATDVDGRRIGMAWLVNDAVADVARGTVARAWGPQRITETLGDVAFELSPASFFQTSTAGARALYDLVGAVLGEGGTLLDLYCGVGAIGLYVGRRFERIVGVEENADAIADAIANAANNGIPAEFRAAKVEDALAILPATEGRRSIVVDPPRVGLHSDVARALAGAAADVLVYVACHPASLGRDAAILEAGGWRLTDVWTVDLFPQTVHVEAVGRFVREPPVSAA